MNTEHLLTQSWNDFVLNINAFMNELGITKDEFSCDHAALRVNTVTRADFLRHFFNQHGRIISENMINGRPILVIELAQPLMLNNTPVPYVELPYPNDKVYPSEGWEHIELVIPGKATCVDELRLHSEEKIPRLAEIINKESAEIKVKFSSPKGDKERVPNPTIALKKNGICIKLHSHSIKAIIDSGQR